MLLERPLSLKLIFHYYNQFKSFFTNQNINWQREVFWKQAIYLQSLFFSFLFCCWFVFVFFFVFFLPSCFLLFFCFFSSITLHCLPLFFFFFTRWSVPVYFFLLSFLFSGGLVFSLIVSVDTQSVTISWRYLWFFGTKSRFVIYSSTASQRHNNKDARKNNRRNDKDAGRLLYKNIYLSLYCKGSKRVTQGFHVRGSWRPNIAEIFWPQSYGR